LAVQIVDRRPFVTVDLITGLRRVLLARLGYFKAGFAIDNAGRDARVPVSRRGICFAPTGWDLCFRPAAAGNKAAAVRAARAWRSQPFCPTQRAIRNAPAAAAAASRVPGRSAML